MILDAENRFSNAQAITASAVSADIIDLGPGAERRIGTGEPLYIFVHVTTAFTDAGNDSTVAVTLESDSVEAFSSATVRGTIGTFAALSAVGSAFLFVIPPDTLTEQFIRLNYTVANGNLTTGAISAFITKDYDSFQFYPKGYTVS